MAELTLKVIDIEGKEIVAHCDSLHLSCKESPNNKNGGNMGIRKGHIKSAIALEKAPIKAYLKGELVMETSPLSGVALVENDFVLVLKD